jgi:hypothetical protein
MAHNVGRQNSSSFDFVQDDLVKIWQGAVEIRTGGYEIWCLCWIWIGAII